jgi:hypothetical protein
MSALQGIWNVSAVAINANGETMQTWIWTISTPTPTPVISFIDPTPADGAILAQNYAFINTTISSTSNTTAFIDWNRSLAGWWRFNGENGESATFFRDWSSFGNNATCSGTGCPTSTTGKYGNALKFDGSNDYINAGHAGSLNITKNITVEAWIKLDKLNAWQVIASKGYPDVSPYWSTVWRLAVSSTNSIQFNIPNVGTANSAGSMIDTNWHHIAGVYNGTKVIVYIDGIQGGISSGSGPITSSTYDLLIGMQANNAFRFNGTMDEVRIHSRALSQDEIRASYNSGIYGLSGNFTNLTTGTYNYRTYVQNIYGNVNQTEARNLTIISV